MKSEAPVLTRKEKIIKEVKSITIIFLVVFSFRSTFYEPFRIPSGSMIPTLMIGDFILVDKWAYGFKLPFSDWFGSVPTYLSDFSGPSRGDIVVFQYPENKQLDYVKRCIGLPGDEIEIIDTVVYINGKAIKVEEFKGNEIMKDMDDRYANVNFRFMKAQTGEHEHTQIFNKNYSMIANMDKVIVPKGHYWMMGDNRDFSSDSRVWGFVPKENIRGKALFVWFSWIIPGSEHPMKFRPWRIGTSLL